MSFQSRQREHAYRPKSEPIDRQKSGFGLAKMDAKGRAVIARMAGMRDLVITWTGGRDAASE